MTGPIVDSIRIEDFLSIRATTIQFGRINVLVGANGAGKTNLIRSFELLGRLVDGELGLFVGRNGGASTLLHDQGRSGELRIVVEAGADTGYDVSLIPAADDELIFNYEGFLGSDGHWDVRRGGWAETTLRVLPRITPSERTASAERAADLLRGWRTFHFHDTGLTAPPKQFAPTGDNITLRGDGGNLGAVLFALASQRSSAYHRIVRAVRQVAPFFKDFVLRPEGDRVRLRWRQIDSDSVFSASQLSDGTLRFICLATLFLQPELPRLVVVDEPELGLHPFAIVQLAELVRQAATRSQVLLATQSVTLLSQFDLSDLLVAERRQGGSEFRRPGIESLTRWLTDYSLGELWEKNLLGGSPRRDDSDRDV